MSTDPRRLPGQLQALVYRAKDEVVRSRAEADAAYLSLYNRLGDLTRLFLENPDGARLEIIALCDLEVELTGDCKATADISELLDPDGEHFQALADARYTVGELPEPRGFVFVRDALRLTPNEEVALSKLKVTEEVIVAGQGNVATYSIVRIK